MDFPSIVSSTSDLAYPQMLHDSSAVETDTSMPLPPLSNHDSPRRLGRPGPPRGLTHLAVITAFILPFTAVPYILARRQISALKRQLAETVTSVKIMEQEMSLSWQEMTNRKNDVQTLRGTLWKLLKDREQEVALIERKESEFSRFQGEVKTDLQKLIKESQDARSQGAMLRSLGISLADVAAFMHEIELEMGMISSRRQDQSGTDRLRSLAQQLQNIEAHACSEPKSPPSTEPKKSEHESPSATSELMDEVDPY